MDNAVSIRCCWSMAIAFIIIMYAGYGLNKMQLETFYFLSNDLLNMEYCERYWNQEIVVSAINEFHDDVIKWKHFPRYWPFVWGIQR